MEREVYKRETLQSKYTTNDDVESPTKGSKDGKTRIARQIETLRNTLSQTTKNNKEYDRKLKQLQAAINERNVVINETQTATEAAEDELSAKMAQIVQSKVEKTKGIFDIVKIQTAYKAYEALAANRFKYEAPENILRERFQKQREINSQMVEVLSDVADSNPQYADVMKSLLRI